MSEIDLLPRADLPVIWNEFKTKAETLRETAENLNVTSIDQKEDMACARRVRLTLREIRIAVEHKRVELGEGHLKEIQKVNGAAKAIREFIEPLEARLLDQETFAERAEARRIAELSKSRMAELSAIRPGIFVPALASMTQAQYDEYLARLRSDVAEVEAANLLRIEAEKRLAETEAASRAALELAQRVALEEKQRRDAEAERLRIEVEFKLAEALTETLRVEQAVRVEAAKLMLEQQAETKRLNDEAERVRDEQDAKYRAEISAAIAQRSLERAEAEQRRQADLQIEREKTAKLEAELAQERAAKQAEADAARRLAVAPDLEQLQGFSRHLQQICKPVLKTIEAEACLSEAVRHFANAIFTIDKFICDRS